MDRAIVAKIFEDAFAKRSEEVIFAAKQAFPSEMPVYSKWKEFVYIRVPEVGGEVLSHLVAKIVLAAISIFTVFLFSGKFYAQSMIWANRLYNCLTTQTSTTLNRAFQSAKKVYKWILDHKVMIFLSGLITRFFLRKSSDARARRLAGRIDFSFVLNSNSYFRIVFDYACRVLLFGWRMANRLSSSMKLQAEKILTVFAGTRLIFSDI